MSTNTNRRQDEEGTRRKPRPEDLPESEDTTSGTPRGGGDVEIPGSSGGSGTIKVTG